MSLGMSEHALEELATAVPANKSLEAGGAG